MSALVSGPLVALVARNIDYESVMSPDLSPGAVAIYRALFAKFRANVAAWAHRWRFPVLLPAWLRPVATFTARHGAGKIALAAGSAVAGWVLAKTVAAASRNDALVAARPQRRAIDAAHPGILPAGAGACDIESVIPSVRTSAAIKAELATALELGAGLGLSAPTLQKLGQTPLRGEAPQQPEQAKEQEVVVDTRTARRTFSNASAEPSELLEESAITSGTAAALDDISEILRETIVDVEAELEAELEDRQRCDDLIALAVGAQKPGRDGPSPVFEEAAAAAEVSPRNAARGSEEQEEEEVVDTRTARRSFSNGSDSAAAVQPVGIDNLPLGNGVNIPMPPPAPIVRTKSQQER